MTVEITPRGKAAKFELIVQHHQNLLFFCVTMEVTPRGKAAKSLVNYTTSSELAFFCVTVEVTPRGKATKSLVNLSKLYVIPHLAERSIFVQQKCIHFNASHI